MKHLRHINEFMSELPYLPYLLMDIAKEIAEKDEDYGITFWDPMDKHVWICVGDSFEDDEEFREKLEMIDGVDKVSIENEVYPSGDGWYEVWPNPGKYRDDDNEALYDSKI